MKIKIVIFFIVIITAKTCALSLDEIISKTVKRYENLNSFYAEFTQTLCDESTGTCKSFDGKIYFLRPNFFRMEIENPEQIYVGDSTSLWIYLPQEKRAIRQNLGQMPFAVNPDIFLKNYEEKFTAQLTTEKDDNFEITLIPKEETEIYKKIAVTIHNKKFEINAISILDETGAESKFNFDNIAINKKISKKLFEFNPPKGIQIDEY